MIAAAKSCGVCIQGRCGCCHLLLVAIVGLLAMETLVDWFFEGPIIFPEFGIFYASTTTTTMVRILIIDVCESVSDMLCRIRVHVLSTDLT